ADQRHRVLPGYADVVPFRYPINHKKAQVVRCMFVLFAGVAQAYDELVHSAPSRSRLSYFFFLGSDAGASSSFLPFLITSGSAAAAGAAASSVGVATASALRATTCAITWSGALTSLTASGSAMSLARRFWPIINSPTSSVNCSWISIGRQSTSTSR